MPSMAVHLAVGAEFLKYNKTKDKKSFRQGILKPDLLGLISQEQKEIAHYTDKKTPNMTLKERCQTKVNLLRYLQDKKIDSDFELGYYVHLVTDFYFFNYFLFSPNHKKINEPNVDLSELYVDYEKIAKDMEIRFNVDNSDTPWAGKYAEGEPVFFSKNEIFEFVEKCSKLNVLLLRDKILKDPPNWRSVAEKFFK